MSDLAKNHSTIAIIGGGASGIFAAIRLLESAPIKAGRFRVVLFERDAKIGRGVAYGTEATFHLLNVRQNGMSAYPEDTAHFSRWLARHHPTAMANPFQPRGRYAEYLGSILSDARRRLPAERFSIRHVAVENIRRPIGGKIEVLFSKGESMACDRVVLATGHGKPNVPEGIHSIRDHARFHGDPWSAAVEKIWKNERILVLGSGLTALDFVFTRMRAGQLASIDLVSRHGLSPLPHSVIAIDRPLAFPFADETVRGVVRALRGECRIAGAEWTDVIDRFRREIPRIWAAWGEGERRRFLRHARPYWDVHRHRVSPEAYREWELYRRGGKVRLEAGRISNAASVADGIEVRIIDRAGHTQTKVYDRVVNCTGAALDLSLIDEKIYPRDPLGLGVPTDSLGRLLTSSGEPDPAVFLLGPALRSRFWEMTAVPDLRLQAKIAIDALLAGLE